MDSLTYGSVALYTCIKGYQFSTKQLRLRIQCEEDGNWTHVQERCTCMGKIYVNEYLTCKISFESKVNIALLLY